MGSHHRPQLDPKLVASLERYRSIDDDDDGIMYTDLDDSVTRSNKKEGRKGVIREASKDPTFLAVNVCTVVYAFDICNKFHRIGYEMTCLQH